MRILKYFVVVLWVTARAAEVASDKTAGVGVVLVVEGQNIIVEHILPDTPAAAQKDLHVCDRIVAIAQDTGAAVQVRNGQLAQALSLIRGPRGTTVSLLIVPAGEDDS